jgi:hypothetical protein
MRALLNVIICILGFGLGLCDLVNSYHRYEVAEYYADHTWHLVPVIVGAVMIGLAVRAVARLPVRQQLLLQSVFLWLGGVGAVFAAIWWVPMAFGSFSTEMRFLWPWWTVLIPIVLASVGAILLFRGLSCWRRSFRMTSESQTR